MIKTIQWILPIRLPSESNLCEHWTKRHRRHLNQKLDIIAKYRQENTKFDLPISIKLIRIAPRKLDMDNLIGAFKFIRDSIADCIVPGLKPGRADGDERFLWIYDQEKGNPKEYAIKIEFICFDKCSFQ